MMISPLEAIFSSWDFFVFQGNPFDLADEGVMPEERLGKLAALPAHREEVLSLEPLERTTLLRVSAKCLSRTVCTT